MAMEREDVFVATAGLLVVLGAAGIGMSIAQGDAEISLVLIFPVISGGGVLFAISALLFAAGLFTFFVAVSLKTASRLVLDESPREPAARPAQPRPPAGPAQWGGVVFIGPIPIAFGSNPRMNRLMLVAAIVMALLFFAFLLGAML
jgi:uncharacterized protein (TIGR00304 family)